MGNVLSHYRAARAPGRRQVRAARPGSSTATRSTSTTWAVRPGRGHLDDRARRTRRGAPRPRARDRRRYGASRLCWRPAGGWWSTVPSAITPGSTRRPEHGRPAARRAGFRAAARVPRGRSGGGAPSGGVGDALRLPALLGSGRALRRDRAPRRPDPRRTASRTAESMRQHAAPSRTSANTPTQCARQLHAVLEVVARPCPAERPPGTGSAPPPRAVAAAMASQQPRAHPTPQDEGEGRER